MSKSSSIFLNVAIEPLLPLYSFLTLHLEVTNTLSKSAIGGSLTNILSFDSIASNRAINWDASFVHEPALLLPLSVI